MQLAQKRMYLKKEILPDHVLYPVFMVFDRVRLVTSSEKEQVNLHVSYSWQRLDATKELLQKGYQALSFTTFTKACKHQNLGLLQAKQFSSLEEKQKILVQSKQFYNQALHLSRNFSDVQQLEIIQLLQEQENLQQIYSN
ncbi:MAG: hypothetical protein HOA85_03645 [Candidatus Pacebacteria bacterium]|nr:hypothetical protein [Candidatus Paceibacterota bacterium]MBT6756346.1 hypothetical protein [Candidatus Paceibacterota bacterium]